MTVAHPLWVQFSPFAFVLHRQDPVSAWASPASPPTSGQFSLMSRGSVPFKLSHFSTQCSCHPPPPCLSSFGVQPSPVSCTAGLVLRQIWAPRRRSVCLRPLQVPRPGGVLVHSGHWTPAHCPSGYVMTPGSSGTELFAPWLSQCSLSCASSHFSVQSTLSRTRKPHPFPPWVPPPRRNDLLVPTHSRCPGHLAWRSHSQEGRRASLFAKWLPT